VEKYGKVGQDTDDNILRLGRIAWWIIKAATDTHSEYANTYCFSAATLIRRTCLSAAFLTYIACLVISRGQVYLLRGTK